jgi:hypothetical protein
VVTTAVVDRYTRLAGVRKDDSPGS